MLLKAVDFFLFFLLLPVVVAVWVVVHKCPPGDSWRLLVCFCRLGVALQSHFVSNLTTVEFRLCCHQVGVVTKN